MEENRKENMEEKKQEGKRQANKEINKRASKGAVVVSETLLEVTAVIISFIVIVLVVQLVFQQQTAMTYQSAFESVARDVSTAIDRASATAGSIFIEQPIPKGMKLNLTIDYKTVLVSYGGNTVRKSTVGLTYASPVTYTNPSSLCIVKTANDNRVYVADGTCKCDLNDNVCDPVCSINNKCDPACVTEKADGICNPYCVKAGDGICDPDCNRNVNSGVFDSDCVRADSNPDGICSPDSNNVKKGICDKDCYTIYSNGNTGVCDPDCPPSDQITEQGGVKYKTSDGICYTGCIDSAATTSKRIVLQKDGICDLDCKDSANICDPDCPDSAACQNKCMKEGEKADAYPCCDGLIACPGDNICKKASGPLSCCGNGICEGRPGTTNGWSAGNKIRWETPYTCQADCPGNAQRPSCSSGSFTSSACYRDIRTQDGVLTGDAPTWGGNAIAVCDAEVQKFLDRRNWDINEVFQSVVQPAPEGYAFDGSRYVNACDKIQNAGQTTSVNEKYTSDVQICCSSAECDFPGAPIGKQCDGIGFCGDHAASILSILRTLGIPDNLVFMTFEIQGGNCGRHGFVIMKCDSSLKNNPKLWPDICNGNEGEWISVDATRHFVTPLRETPCVSLGLFWNDKGIYPLTYGALQNGPNGQKRGYVHPADAICNTAGELTEEQCKNDQAIEHHFDELCNPYNVECVVP